MTSWKWLSGFIPLLFSVAGLVILLTRLDWSNLLVTLQSMEYAYFIGSLLLATLVQFMFPWRWLILLNYRASFWKSCTACFAGDFINALTPLRMGEIVRIILLRRSTAIPFSEALSTIALAQVLDLLSIVLLGAGLLLIVPLPDALVNGGAVVGVLTLVALAVLWLAARNIDRIMNWLETSVQQRLNARLTGMIRGVLNGLHTLRNPWQVLYAGLISVSLWLLIGVAGWVMLRGLMPDPAFALGIAVAVAGGIGRILPALPGSIGTLDVAVALSLTTLGVPDSTALAFTLLIRLRYVLHTALLGAVAFVGEGLNTQRLRSLVNESRA